MARDHARFKVSTHNDRDWRKLTIAGQHMYWTLMSHPDLSYAGVMDWWPNRLAALAADATEQSVYAALAELQDARFVFLDPDQSELLIRTYVKHDNILERLNMGKACATAIGKIHSLDLRDMLCEELAKLHGEKPMLAGWQGIKETDSDLYETVISIRLGMQMKVESR